MSRPPVRFQDTNAYRVLVSGCLPMLIVLVLIIAAIVVILKAVF